MSFYRSLAPNIFGTGTLARRQQEKKRDKPAPRPVAGTGLPKLPAAQVSAVIHEAEQAAIRVALGSTEDASNPYPERTRAHILWETHFQSVLMEWSGG